MGKQKLNRYEVMIIKHLIKHGYTDEFISDFIGKCTHKNIWKIRCNHRWVEVDSPDEKMGVKLLIHYAVYGNFDNHLI